MGQNTVTYRTIFSKIRTPIDAVPVVIATGFGAGFSPVAPGTAGSLVALPIIWALSPLSGSAKFAFWSLCLALGTWASMKVNGILKSSDASVIVIDEILGMGIASWTVSNQALGLAVAFAFFRLFDIVKLPPVRQLDRASKTWSGWKGGLGVMLDDALAAFQTLLVVLGLQSLGWLT